MHKFVKRPQRDVLSDSEVLQVLPVNSAFIAAMEVGDEADLIAGPSAAFGCRFWLTTNGVA